MEEIDLCRRPSWEDWILATFFPCIYFGQNQEELYLLSNRKFGGKCLPMCLLDLFTAPFIGPFLRTHYSLQIYSFVLHKKGPVGKRLFQSFFCYNLSLIRDRDYLQNVYQSIPQFHFTMNEFGLDENFEDNKPSETTQTLITMERETI